MDAHSAYVWGVAAALAGALLHACANVFDSYLSNRLSHRLSDLVVLSATTNLLFLPLSAVIDAPHSMSGSAWLIAVAISVINVFYHFPYYRALQDCDTSIVSSLFSLGKVFTPLLAFWFVGETLTAVQYAGFFLIVAASTLLTFERAQFRFNKALFYMIGVSVALIVQAILFKKLYEDGVTWGTSVFWTTLFDFVIAAVLVCVQRRARELIGSLSGLGRDGVFVVLDQFLTWSGEVVGLYALTLIPVSVFEGVGSAQPMFVLVISLLFLRRFPELLKENLGGRSLGGKFALFAVIVIGTLLILRHE